MKTCTPFQNTTRTHLGSECSCVSRTWVRSNLFATSIKQGATVTVRDVSYTETGLLLNVHCIKTITFKCGWTILPLRAILGPFLCPQTAMVGLKQMHSAQKPSCRLSSLPLNSKKSVALGVDTFICLLKQGLSNACCNSTRFLVHSFWWGAATYALGVATAVLEAQEAWRSDCFLRYISRDAHHRGIFAHAISNACIVGEFCGEALRTF